MGSVVMFLSGLQHPFSIAGGLAGALTVRLPMATVSPAALSQETLLVLAAYAALAGIYLLVVPLGLYWWMKKRWTLMGKLERTFIYGMVFLFFPGLILFAPFLNFRLAGSGEGRA